MLDDGRSISQNVAHLNILAHDMINLLYYEMIKFGTVWVLELKEIESNDETKYRKFYFYSKAEKIINESIVDDIFEYIYSTIKSDIQKYLRKGLIWIVDSVVDHSITILKYKPLSGSSYVKLPKELDDQKRFK